MVTIVQPATCAANPADCSGSRTSASVATRSPNAYVAATAAASSSDETANPVSDARRSPATSAYNSPPAPMPASATASTRPNVNTDPPSSGPSSRYQINSSRKNAKPTVADAMSANTGRPGPSRRSGGSGRSVESG